MTFGDFKTFLGGISKGEIKVPEDGELKVLIRGIIVTKIANACYPIRLIESDRTKAEMLFPIPVSEHFFIRKPEAIGLDSSEIDLDDDLCYAVAYFIAATLVKSGIELNKRENLRAEAHKIIQNHLCRSYDYINNKESHDDC